MIKEKKIELEADRFAMEILIPRKSFLETIERYPFLSKMNHNNIRILAEMYNVEQAVMADRFLQLTA